MGLEILLLPIFLGVITNYISKKGHKSIDAGNVNHGCEQEFQGILIEMEAEFGDCFGGLTLERHNRDIFFDTLEEEFLWSLDEPRMHPEPDRERLWQEYRDIFEEDADWPAEDRFKVAIGALWYAFIGSVERNQVLKHLIRDKYIAMLGEAHVYHEEARLLLREYCQLKASECEEMIRREYAIDVPEVELSSKDNYHEFCSYIPTPMKWVKQGRTQLKEEQPVTDKSYRNHRIVVVFGNGGVGKTRFFQEEEKELLTGVNQELFPSYLPLYLKASDVASVSYPVDLINLVSGKLANILKSPKHSIKKIQGLAEYLLKHNMVFPLIDAFDQLPNNREHVIGTVLREASLFGSCRRFISTRPYDLKALQEILSGVHEGVNIIHLYPFKKEQLPDFFGRYYKNIKGLLESLEKRDSSWNEKNADFLHVPLLARLLKQMALSGEIGGIQSKTALMERFVRHVVTTQCKKDKIKEATTVDAIEDFYFEIVEELEQLALGTIRDKGQDKFHFKRDRVREILGRRSKTLQLAYMRKIEFVKPFIDHETDPVYRFHHQLLQEFFAAKALWRNYQDEMNKRNPDHSELFEALDDIHYDPEEVGSFFAQLIATGKCPEESIVFWQENVLMNPELKSDWVRTYALQVRDTIADTNEKAREWLEDRFAEEMIPREEYEKKDIVGVPAGSFLYGSYQYEDERPVRLETLAFFELDRFPVTNLQFCEFLKDCFSGEEVNGEDREKIIDFDESKIKWNGQEHVIESKYGSHPVTGVTLYGADHYCRWKSEREKLSGFTCRLPSEHEWEKAARGRLGRQYPWGNKFYQEKCNTYEGSKEGTTRIGDFSSQDASPYGCHDMAGNVYEWTSSFYDEAKNTIVLRGGSWGSVRVYARCAYRGRLTPGDWYYNAGFRCARTAVK